MENDFYVVVQWPEIQFYMELEGFRENAYLINCEQGLTDFGASAYFISYDWLKTITHE